MTHSSKIAREQWLCSRWAVVDVTGGTNEGLDVRVISSAEFRRVSPHTSPLYVGRREPRVGGICISRRSYDQVQKKDALGYRSLGPQNLKNIPEPRASQYPAHGRYTELSPMRFKDFWRN